MFDLRPDDLKGRILGCADGPASFNSELTRRGGRVVSVDPLYELKRRREIAQRIEETRDEVISQTWREQQRFVWDTIGSVEELARIRMAAMKAFLDDYEVREERRALPGGWPAGPALRGWGLRSGAQRALPLLVHGSALPRLPSRGAAGALPRGRGGADLPAARRQRCALASSRADPGRAREQRSRRGDPGGSLRVPAWREPDAQHPRAGIRRAGYSYWLKSTSRSPRSWNHSCFVHRWSHHFFFSAFAAS